MLEPAVSQIFKTGSMRSRWEALLCVALLPVCSFLIRPGVETGMMDEWSYARSAQVLAETGHVVYNGWATAMLGWQLLWGAAFFKLFGFSYLVARISGLVVAMATVFLMHRLFVRTGLSRANATFATMTVVLCPVFFPLALSFMSDMPGMFAVVLCGYACVRAIQGESEKAQAAWICFAALSNAVGGTARQIAWVGVLVMVPCVLWLLRARRKVLVVGAASWLAGVGIVMGAMHWFRLQPFSVKEALRRSDVPTVWKLQHLHGNVLRPTLELALFLLPVLVLFLPAVWSNRRRAVAAVVAWLAAGLAALGMVRSHHAGLGLIAPFLRLHGNYMSPFGLFYRWPMHCHYPVVLGRPMGIVLTVVTILGIVALGVTVAFRGGGARDAPEERPLWMLSWMELLVLVIPFCMGYAVLLLSRLSIGATLDRYLVPLMPMLLILMLRVYQERIAARIPLAAWGLLALVGVYSVAATHDLFANYRAALAAIDEMRASGIPRTQIDGGWEYNAETQLNEGGFVHQEGLRMPGHQLFTVGTTVNACPIDDLYETPDVLPQYSLSMDETACQGEAGFAPVTYRRWLSPRTATIFIVKNPVVARKRVVAGAVHHNTGGVGGPGDLCWGTDAKDAMSVK